MKNSGKLLPVLIVILFISVFLLGNLSSELFNIKVSIKSLFGVPIEDEYVKQVPIKSTVKPAVKTVSSVTASKTTSAVRPIQQTLVKKIGESYTLGSMEYKITSAVNNGSTYSYAKTAGKFIVVKILVKNIGKVNSKESVIMIKDKNDRQYKQSGIMNGIMVTSGKTYGSSDYNGLAAGFSETYTAIFEVAKDSSGLKLCHPSTTGIDLVCVQLDL